MLNRTALLIAVATVTAGLTGSAMAQTATYSNTTVYTPTTEVVVVPNEAARTGATDSLGVRNNTSKAPEQLRQPAVWKGQRAPNQLVNVGNSLPERTAFGNIGDIDNSNTGTMNHLPSGEVVIERQAIVASERMERIEPAPAPAPMVTEERVVVTDDGLDHRFLKPADPAVVTPDHKMNAGIDRTLAQDKNLYGRDQRMGEYRASDELALKDISNHPIDSLNDPAYKGPVIDESTLYRAQPASERIEPDTYVAPAPVAEPAPTYVPVAPQASTEFKSTWSSESDRLASDPAIRPEAYPNGKAGAWKGERAPNALDNTPNPAPATTVFGKTGDRP